MRSVHPGLLTVAVACVSLGGCQRKEPRLKMGEERVVFTGKVELVEMLGRRKATVYPVGVDPRFLLTVHVGSVEKNRSSPVVAGQTINFAIHSPSKLLGVDDTIGQTFLFEAIWMFGPRKEFSWLEARPAPAPARPERTGT